MSIFKVNLNNTKQGLMDIDCQNGSTVTNYLGAQFTTSKQRTVYIMGPNKINRKLKDGETFQDCNYYKRFCYPQVSYEDAILTCTSDDGSVYSDVSEENTFPYVVTRTIGAGTTYATPTTNNTIDILTLTGGYASFVQLTNASDASSGTNITIILNGSATASFTLEKGTTQVFNAGDLMISRIDVVNTASGAGVVPLEVMCAIKSTCNS